MIDSLDFSFDAEPASDLPFNITAYLNGLSNCANRPAKRFGTKAQGFEVTLCDGAIGGPPA
ncbi:hypothetical protein DSM110093_03936 (plasmid) [Sulfitobacter sp. DSM 110093]|nr:hypothetical protein DSM110093_03936 [Sulfitobacter sp. DSM 110093]